MGLDPVSLGVAGVGAAAGAAKGAKGTPDQKTISQTTFAPAGGQEQELQRQSVQNYIQQQNLARQYEQGIGSLDPLRQQSIQASQDIVGGGAFNLTPDEQARLEAQRSALVQAGSSDIQRGLQDQLQQIQGNAATRGLRGQAVTQLQGDRLRANNDALTSIVNQANIQASNQALALPQQRIAAQSPYIQQGLTLRDQLLQNAQNNRNMLQSPFLLQLLNQERMQSGQTTSNTPGQRGGFGQALIGGLGGAASGYGQGMGYSSAAESLRFNQGLNEYAKKNGYGGIVTAMRGGNNNGQ